MKKIRLLLYILFVAGIYHAQTPTASQNYIYTKVYLSEDGSKKTETVQYFDGLGRLKQTVSVKSTATGKDLVVPVLYDALGRQAKDLLPLPMPTANLGIQTVSEANINSYYGASNAYTEKIFDNSPLGRVSEIAAPGDAWKKGSGHTLKLEYETNTSADRVKKYGITSSWANATLSFTVPKVGWYAENQLMKNTTIDEDGNKSIEFKNSRGQILLVRKMNGTAPVDTYYIYNLYDQLVLVIPPKADEQITQNANVVTQAILDQLCYQYKYDHKNRLVEKRIPGKKFWEYLVYDKQNRLVLTQDANQHLKQWAYIKYDQWGRVAYTGLLANTSGRVAIQHELNNISGNAMNNESRAAAPFMANGRNIYYTNTAYPAGNTAVLTVNYYDDYAPGAPAKPASVLGKATLGTSPVQYSSNGVVSYRSTKGMATSSDIKNIEDGNWTQSHIWYDTEARPVGTHTINHLGGYTRTEALLDFAGVVQQSKTYHKRLGTDTEKLITETFEYDSQNRLKKHWHQVNGNPRELLSENTYNDLSRLSNKKTGNNLQSIDYIYNIRGWLTRINTPAALGTKLFGYELRYQDPSNTNLATGRYNGNIAEITWKTAANQVLRRYSYQYDPLNRLQKGIYSEPNASVPQNNFYNETIEYDINSNITSLERNTKNSSGTAILMDNLIYSYTGNMLNSVKDNSSNYEGYPDTSGNPVSYDDNGNMKDHTDKGILQISYAHTNQPDYIIFDQTYIPRDFARPVNVKTEYLYDAAGSKLRKKHSRKGPNKGNGEELITTDYLDGFQYETRQINDSTPVTTLQIIPTAEGYYDFEKNRYIYHYTDHLGNIRVSYTRNGPAAEIIEENNYYPFGLKHEGYNNLAGNPAYKYQYNGKELQQETGWNDYGARMYMADIGRWGVVDPLTESYRRWSPYHYAMNNPVRFIDPDGMGSYDAQGVWRSEMEDFNNYHRLGSEYSPKDLYINADGSTGGDARGGSSIEKLLSELLSVANNTYIPDFGKFDFNYPPNEYEIDLTTGKKRQISNLGGDEIDFYHYIGGGPEFNGRTRVVDRETGVDQWMSSSKNILGYSHRGNSVDWNLLYDEFLTGTGPEKSLLIGKENKAVRNLIKTQIYLDAATFFLSTSTNEKISYAASFGPWGAVRENTNMQGQFMGKTNFSFYPVGNKVVIMAFDSKSISSYSLNPFNKGEARNIPRSNGIGIRQSTTHQTYIWWTNRNNLFK